MLKTIKKAAIFALWLLFRIFPVKKNKVLMSSFFGKGYGDNLKYITESLNKAGKGKVRIYWVISDKKEAQSLPGYVIPVKKPSLAYLYHVMTARVWIDNCRKFYLFKSKKQFYIQTWHGGGMQKRCEADVEDALDKGYISLAKRDSRGIDLMISESRVMTEMFHRAFWYDGPVYQCGYPRYDAVMRVDGSIREKVENFFGISADKGIALYAPTFRKDGSIDAYDVDHERFIANLKEKFNKEFVLLIRLHPNIADRSELIEYGENIINASHYPDMQELLAAADVLLGDYSSVNYDFCLKRGPVFRYASDLKDYIGDRDFYFGFDEYPFPFATDNDELETVVKGFDENEYLENLDAFFKKLGAVTEYGASDRVADIVLEYLKSKNKSTFFDNNEGRFIY